MANTATGIKNSWSLINFAKQFGSPKLAKCTNGNSGEIFSCVAFGERDNITFVSFSPKLGELTVSEIVQQKNDLQVVLCETKTGRDMYSLCKKGDPSEAWQDIDLGI